MKKPYKRENSRADTSKPVCQGSEVKNESASKSMKGLCGGKILNISSSELLALTEKLPSEKEPMKLRIEAIYRFKLQDDGGRIVRFAADRRRFEERLANAFKKLVPRADRPERDFTIEIFVEGVDAWVAPLDAVGNYRIEYDIFEEAPIEVFDDLLRGAELTFECARAPVGPDFAVEIYKIRASKTTGLS
jgi:hypothetical protein